MYKSIKDRRDVRVVANIIEPNLLVPKEWTDNLTLEIFNKENNSIDNTNSTNDTL